MASRRGIDAPRSTMKIEVDPAKLPEEIREFLADHLYEGDKLSARGPAARHHVAAEEKADRVHLHLSQRFDQRTYLILRRLFQPSLRRRVRNDLARSSRSMTSALLI